MGCVFSIAGGEVIDPGLSGAGATGTGVIGFFKISLWSWRAEGADGGGGGNVIPETCGGDNSGGWVSFAGNAGMGLPTGGVEPGAFRICASLAIRSCSFGCCSGLISEAVFAGTGNGIGTAVGAGGGGGVGLSRPLKIADGFCSGGITDMGGPPRSFVSDCPAPVFFSPFFSVGAGKGAGPAAGKGMAVAGLGSPCTSTVVGAGAGSGFGLARASGGFAGGVGNEIGWALEAGGSTGAVAGPAVVDGSIGLGDSAPGGGGSREVAWGPGTFVSTTVGPSAGVTVVGGFSSPWPVPMVIGSGTGFGAVGLTAAGLRPRGFWSGSEPGWDAGVVEPVAPPEFGTLATGPAECLALARPFSRSLVVTTTPTRHRNEHDTSKPTLTSRVIFLAPLCPNEGFPPSPTPRQSSC